MMRNTFSLLLSALLCWAPARAQDVVPPDVTRTAVTVELANTGHYPLDVCIVTKQALTKDAIEFEAGGRKFRVADAKARAEIEKDPKPWVSKLDQASIEQQSPHCKFDRCPNCRGAFAANQDPIYVVADGLVLRVCGEACKTLRRSTSSRAGVSIRAELAHRTTRPYPAKACPVCDKPLDEKAIWVQHGWSVVKVNSEECLAKLKVAPNAYVAKALGLATPAKPEGAKPDGAKPAAPAGDAPTKPKGEAAAEKRGN